MNRCKKYIYTVYIVVIIFSEMYEVLAVEVILGSDPSLFVIGQEMRPSTLTHTQPRVHLYLLFFFSFFFFHFYQSRSDLFCNISRERCVVKQLCHIKPCPKFLSIHPSSLLFSNYVQYFPLKVSTL